MNRYFLIGLFPVILLGCSTENQTLTPINSGQTFIQNGKSAPCVISASYKTPACYVTPSQSGAIVVTNKKPDCKNAVCAIPACSTIINYLPSGKVERETTPCASY